MKSSIQTVGYASWTDPHKWMEAMKGARWRVMVKQYQDEYTSAVKKVGDLPATLVGELEQRQTSISPNKLHDCYYQQVGRTTFAWWFSKQEKTYCADLDIQSDGYVWYVQDTPSGDEEHALHCNQKDKHLWSYKKPLGPFVAVVKDRVYCLESDNHLWFRRLVSLDSHTGKDRKVHYEEMNPQWNLTLLKGENHCLFLLANNAGKQRLWYLDSSKGLVELLGYDSFLPIGFARDSSDPVYFGRKASSPFYECIGHPSFSFLREETPEFASLTDNLLVSKHLGKRSLWSGKRKIDTVLGQFQPDLLSPWIEGHARLSLSRPGYDMVLYEPNVDCLCSYAVSIYKMAKSKDSTNVPYVIVKSREKRPTHLLVVGYGAYGVSTHLNTDRWKPLLRRGWAVCLALVRGGGDHTDQWAQDGRTTNKQNSIDDFVACIRAAQRNLRIGSSRTAIYGRSAGGYLVGTTVAQHATGHLFQCAYMEVPYVDVLSTTSNPSLPLTQMEYNEFGNPRQKLQNFKALLELSPIDILPETGAPSIFILCRTGLHDKEVFAYESFKWITKLKDAQGSQGQPKLLAANAQEGHFVNGPSATENRANDLALLIQWAMNTSPSRKKKYHYGIYNMANTRRNNRKNRKNTRRNRKNNVTARKNNVNMMGGKRRRRNMTRRRR